MGYVRVEHVRRDPNPFRHRLEYLELDQMGVLPEVRRRGIGRRLVGEVTALAGRLGVGRVELSAWEFNESAIASYERAGFDTMWRRMTLGVTDIREVGG